MASSGIPAMWVAMNDGRNRSLFLYVAILVLVCFVCIVELEAKPVDGTLEGSEFVLRELAADSCANLTEVGCIACTSTSLCNWCGKLGSCHALGSPYGCLWGTSCLAPSECMRKEPEFVGYAKPSWVVVLAISLGIVLLLMCGLVTILIARVHAKASKVEEAALHLRQIEGMGYELLECSEDGCGSEGQPGYYLDGPSVDSTTMNNLIESSPGTQPNNETLMTPPMICSDVVLPRDGPPHSSVTDDLVVDLEDTRQHSTPRQHNSKWLLRRVPRGKVTQNSKGPSHSWLLSLVYNGVKLLCGCFMIAVVVGGIGIALYFPHSPVVNICNTEFEWESIVHSMETLQAIVDVEILASLYNPNYFHLRVSSGTGVFKHAHREVGQMIMHDTVYKGGDVTDALITTSFDTEAWEGLKLGYQYEMGQLDFLVDINLYVSVKAFGFYSWTFPITFNDYYVAVANITKYDRHLCHCPDMV